MGHDAQFYLTIVCREEQTTGFRNEGLAYLFTVLATNRDVLQVRIAAGQSSGGCHRLVERCMDVTRDERTKSKRANFGIIYGITVFGLAERLDIPRDEAKMLIDGYFDTFPQVHDYMEHAKEVAREQGYVTTLFGRRRYLPDIRSANATVRGFAERNAINAPIQGTAADIIKVAMINIFKRFKSEGIRSKMILQVHDELNFSVFPEEKDRVEAIVLDEMQRAFPLDVPLIADSGFGENWLEAH